MKGHFKMKFFKKFAAVLIAMAVFTVGNIGILPRDAVEDFMFSVRALDSDIVTSGECGAQGDNLTWTLDSEGTLTISGEGEMKDFEYNYDYDVSTDNPWFKYKENILNIVIEDEVTNIGNGAFRDHYGLTSVTIPGNIKRIGDAAFHFCDKLESIIICDGVVTIEEDAFSWIAISSIDIPETVLFIGDYAFNACWNLKSVTLPESIAKIESCTFMQTGLITITIPYSIKSIDTTAFEICENLEEVYYKGSEVEWNCIEIGDGNEYLTNATIHYSNDTERRIIDSGECGAEGDNLTWAFDNEGTLTISGKGKMKNFKHYYFYDAPTDIPWYDYREYILNISIDEGVLSIGDCAFLCCLGLTSVTIPSNIKHIGDGAFYSCENLDSIIICDGVVSIGESAFSWTSISSIDIPETVILIEDYAFNSCSNLESVTLPENIVSIGSYAFGGSGISGIEIPQGVTSIGAETFKYCENLTSITLSDSIYSIGESAFNYCYKLSDVYYLGTEEEWNEIYISYDNSPLRNAKIHFEGSGATIGKYEALTYKNYGDYIKIIGCDKNVDSVKIPSEIGGVPVTVIGREAFEECNGLLDVLIPDSVTRIERSAFYHCDSLLKIKLPSNLVAIGYGSFNSCHSVFIPKSVKIIDGLIDIDETPSLSNIYYSGSELEWNDIIGLEHQWIDDVTIHYESKDISHTIISPGECGVKGDNITWTFDNNGTFTITGEGEMADYNGDYEEDYFSINSSAPWRYYGNQMREVIVKGNVKNIGNYSFNGCKNLKYVILPSDIEEIGKYAFANCEKLTSVTGGNDSIKGISKNPCTKTGEYDII